MKLDPGPSQNERANVKSSRGMAFCGLGAFVGTGKTQRAHVYTATSVTDVTPETPKKIDPQRLARELEETCARSTADVSGPWTKSTSRGAISSTSMVSG